MAQGDVISSITDTAAATLLTIQPGAGVHWLVKDFFASGDGTNGGYFLYYDGTDIGSPWLCYLTDIDFNSYRMGIAGAGNELNIVLNNSLYCQIFNRSTSSRKCGLTAIQIK